MSERPASLPENYNRIRVVDSFAAMCGDDFAAGENALLLPRRLTGAFNLLAWRLTADDWKDREAVLKSYAGPRLHRIFGHAAQQILTDMEMLHDHGYRPELRVVRKGRYPSSVLNYHVDRGSCRIICCYNDPVTRALRNEDAIPADPKRANGSFRAREGALPFAFHAGDIWRHKAVPLDDESNLANRMGEAFIHCAPRIGAWANPRLMLVGEYTRR